MSDRLQYQYAYRRKLPHIQPPGATLFVTFRLAGSLPQALLQELRDEVKAVRLQVETIVDEDERVKRLDLVHRREFARLERSLDGAASGPTWPSDPRIAQMVADKLTLS